MAEAWTLVLLVPALLVLAMALVTADPLGLGGDAGFSTGHTVGRVD